jgi:hypothetical protein
MSDISNFTEEGVAGGVGAFFSTMEIDKGANPTEIFKRENVENEVGLRSFDVKLESDAPFGMENSYKVNFLPG